MNKKFSKIYLLIKVIEKVLPLKSVNVKKNIITNNNPSITFPDIFAQKNSLKNENYMSYLDTIKKIKCIANCS